MINVGLFSAHDPQLWLRQTIKGDGAWGSIKVRANPIDYNDHYIAIYDVPKHSFFTKVPKLNRILFLTEPPGSKFYSPFYLSQFGTIISPFRLNKLIELYVKFWGSEIRYQQACLPWHAGINFSVRPHLVNMSFSDFNNLTQPTHYKHRLSIVTSNKKDRPEQIRRLKLIKELQNRLGDQIAIYGRGFNNINDKFDGIFGSQFHLVLENNFENNFWTEKLSDSYLCWSYPLYLGTSGICQDFPKNSYFRLDSNLSISEIADKIVERLQRGLIDQDIAAMKVAREIILQKHNLFAVMESLIDQLPASDLLEIPEKINSNFDPRPKIVIKKVRRHLKAKLKNVN
jgi:hypothetical protein